EFVEHYHLERNHQGLDNRLIAAVAAATNENADPAAPTRVANASAASSPSTTAARRKNSAHAETVDAPVIGRPQVFTAVVDAHHRRPAKQHRPLRSERPEPDSDRIRPGRDSRRFYGGPVSTRSVPIELQKSV